MLVRSQGKGDINDSQRRLRKAGVGVGNVTKLNMYFNILNDNTGRRLLFNNYYHYSTIMPFYHIRSREGAKYEAIIHCSVLV